MTTSPLSPLTPPNRLSSVRRFSVTPKNLSADFSESEKTNESFVERTSNLWHLLTEKATTFSVFALWEKGKLKIAKIAEQVFSFISLFFSFRWNLFDREKREELLSQKVAFVTNPSNWAKKQEEAKKELESVQAYLTCFSPNIALPIVAPLIVGLPGVKSESTSTPLASAQGQLEEAATPLIHSLRGESPLRKLAKENKRTKLEVLFWQKEHPIHEALQAGEGEIALSLIEKRPVEELLVQDQYGDTVFHYACRAKLGKEFPKIIRSLFNKLSVASKDEVHKLLVSENHFREIPLHMMCDVLNERWEKEGKEECRCCYIMLTEELLYSDLGLQDGAQRQLALLLGIPWLNVAAYTVLQKETMNNDVNLVKHIKASDSSFFKVKDREHLLILVCQQGLKKAALAIINKYKPFMNVDLEDDFRKALAISKENTALTEVTKQLQQLIH